MDTFTYTITAKAEETVLPSTNEDSGTAVPSPAGAVLSVLSAGMKRLPCPCQRGQRHHLKWQLHRRLRYRHLCALAPLPAILSSLPLVAGNLHFTNLDASLPPLMTLTLTPQEPGFTFDLYSALPPASSTLTALSTLPGDCTPYVGPRQECTTNMTTMNVYFEDCGDQFVMCRCMDVTMSMGTVVDHLGRVPVGLQRYMGVVVVLEDTELHAYTLTNGNIHFCDCAMDMWVHEATHLFDFATPSPHSGIPGWAEAIANDSCVPENYSLTNRIEACGASDFRFIHVPIFTSTCQDFVQMNIIKTYTLLYDRHLPPGFRTDCMAHQLDFFGTLPLYNALALFGNMCHIVDRLLGMRHDTPPPVLDPAHTFTTVSVNWSTVESPMPALTPVHDSHVFRPNSAWGLRPAILLLMTMVLLASVLV
ncbi:hypothetical protein C8R44DRAFT_885709 [Mycena epipterygia]|nr:hypothetical protein C8R44DRAFT_885709 [Mycena epipterygia]